MHSTRRPGSPLASFTVLIGIFILLIVSVAEAFKVFNSPEDGAGLSRREGSRFLLAEPWKPAQNIQQRDSNPTSSFGNLIGALSDVAGNLMNGISVASNVASTNKPDATAVQGVGKAVGTSPMKAVDDAINQPTGVDEGTLLNNVSGVSNIGVLLGASSAVEDATSGTPEEATSTIEISSETGSFLSSTSIQALKASASPAAVATSLPQTASQGSSSPTSSLAPGATGLSSGNISSSSIADLVNTSASAGNLSISSVGLSSSSLMPSRLPNSTMSALSAGNSSMTSSVMQSSPPSIPSRLPNSTVSTTGYPFLSSALMSSSLPMPSHIQDATVSAGNMTSSAHVPSESAKSNITQPTSQLRNSTLLMPSPPAQNVTTPEPNNGSRPMLQSPQMPQNLTVPRPANITMAESTCPSVSTLTLECLAPATSTEFCTVTETWHSTVFAETATLFSFMSIFTVTSTATISNYAANDMSIAMALPSLAANSNGSMPTPSGPYHFLSPANPTAGSKSSYQLPSLKIGASQSSSNAPPALSAQPVLASQTSKFSSFSSQVTSLAALEPVVIGDSQGTIKCADGSMVTRTIDCPDDVASSETAPVAFGEMPHKLAVEEREPRIFKFGQKAPVKDERQFFSVVARTGGKLKRETSST